MPPLIRSHILCVDDDPDACEMLTALLVAYGISATCVESGPEALLAINEKSFDLYVLDGWLPYLDGFELCRQIRQVDAKTPIVFYSGAAYDADRQKGMAAGANAYIAKPNVEGLISTMSSLLDAVNTPQVIPREALREITATGWFSPKTMTAANAAK